MKTVLIACLLLPLCGCVAVQTTHQHLTKVTVAGLEIAPNPSGSLLSVVTYSVRFGIVRYEYLDNPTSSNGPIYAAPFTSSVEAKLNVISQSATENISTK